MNCEYCNDTKRVPKNNQNEKLWWINNPMDGETWAQTEFVDCPHCGD